MSSHVFDDPRKFLITFWGRNNGALGVRSKFTKTITAYSQDEAVLRLYDTHEHIHVIYVQII